MILDRLMLVESKTEGDRSTDVGFFPRGKSEPIFGDELLAYCKQRRKQEEDIFINTRGAYKSTPLNIDMWDLRMDAIKNPKITKGSYAVVIDENGSEIKEIKVYKNGVGAIFIIDENGDNISQWVRLDNEPETEDEEVYVRIKGSGSNTIISWFDEDMNRWKNVQYKNLLTHEDEELEIEPIEEFKARVKAKTGYDLLVGNSKQFDWKSISRNKLITTKVRCNYATGEIYKGE